jgi:hypothetical protein
VEKEMEELHTEGVATHGDPESCAVAREDDGEALTGARAGRAIEPRNPLIRGADAVDRSGRPHRLQRYRELLADPARSKTPCMHGISMRENREVPRPLAWVITGRAAQGTLRRYA